MFFPQMFISLHHYCRPMMRAEIRVAEVGDAESLARSLGPEAGRDMPRTDVAVAVEDDALVLTIEAGEMTSLRAALNSYLRWLKRAVDTQAAIEGDEGGMKATIKATIKVIEWKQTRKYRVRCSSSSSWGSRFR